MDSADRLVEWRPTPVTITSKATIPLSQTTPPLALQPFTTLPIDCIERILEFLTITEIGRLAFLSTSFKALVSPPHLYKTIHLSSRLHPSLLNKLPSLLPTAHNVTLRAMEYLTLRPTLVHVSYHLRYLDLTFSAIEDEMLGCLVDGGQLDGLEELILKGCRGVQDAGVLGSLKRLNRLDLSWSGVRNVLPLSDLPSPSPSDSGFFDLTTAPPFPSLTHLSLSSCGSIPNSSLTSFLSFLPPSLHSLNLSSLPLLPPHLFFLLLSLPHSSLASLDITQCHALTVSDIKRFKDAWSGVEVRSDAVLESEEEGDVRRFVWWVSGRGSLN